MAQCLERQWRSHRDHPIDPADLVTAALSRGGPPMNTGDAAWLMTSAALVLFMTPGLALFYGGMDRSRNVLNMLMMNFWCLLIIPIVWVVIGYSLAQDPFGNDFIGSFDCRVPARRRHHRA